MFVEPGRDQLLERQARVIGGDGDALTLVAYGVIATPAGSAQQVCDMMVEAGLDAILNFAPVQVKAP